MTLGIIEILNAVFQIPQKAVAIQQSINNVASQQLSIGNGF